MQWVAVDSSLHSWVVLQRRLLVNMLVESIIEFTATGGEIFSLAVFFIFGVLVASLLPGITLVDHNLCGAKPHPYPDAACRDIPGKNPVTTGISLFHRVVRSPRTCIDCAVTHNPQRLTGYTRAADDCDGCQYHGPNQRICTRITANPPIDWYAGENCDVARRCTGTQRG